MFSWIFFQLRLLDVENGDGLYLKVLLDFLFSKKRDFLFFKPLDG